MGSNESRILTKEEIDGYNEMYKKEVKLKQEHLENVRYTERMNTCISNKKDFIKAFNTAAKENPNKVEVQSSLWTTFAKCGIHNTESLLNMNDWERLPETTTKIIHYDEDDDDYYYSEHIVFKQKWRNT